MAKNIKDIVKPKEKDFTTITRIGHIEPITKKIYFKSFIEELLGIINGKDTKNLLVDLKYSTITIYEKKLDSQKFEEANRKYQEYLTVHKAELVTAKEKEKEEKVRKAEEAEKKKEEERKLKEFEKLDSTGKRFSLLEFD